MVIVLCMYNKLPKLIRLLQCMHSEVIFWDAFLPNTFAQKWYRYWNEKCRSRIEMVHTIANYSLTTLSSLLKSLIGLILQHVRGENSPVAYDTTFFQKLKACLCKKLSFHSLMKSWCRTTLEENIWSAYKTYYSLSCGITVNVLSVYCALPTIKVQYDVWSDKVMVCCFFLWLILNVKSILKATISSGNNF